MTAFCLLNRCSPVEFPRRCWRNFFFLQKWFDWFVEVDWSWDFNRLYRVLNFRSFRKEYLWRGIVLKEFLRRYKICFTILLHWLVTHFLFPHFFVGKRKRPCKCFSLFFSFLFFFANCITLAIQKEKNLDFCFAIVHIYGKWTRQNHKWQNQKRVVG